MLASKSLTEYTAAAAICLLIFAVDIHSLIAASFYTRDLKSGPLFLLILLRPG